MMKSIGDPICCDRGLVCKFHTRYRGQHKSFSSDYFCREMGDLYSLFTAPLNEALSAWFSHVLYVLTALK